MSTATTPLSKHEWTAADLVQRFGPIPLSRVCTRFAPGTATEQDVESIRARESRLCELVDGILVEKAMGQFESAVAMQLGALLIAFIRGTGLGRVFGADGMMKLAWGLVRIPDVSFVSTDRLRVANIQPHAPLAVLVPNLAVEVLSPGNTDEEMDEKLHDYFSHGVELVWYIDPRQQSVTVYRSLDDCHVVRAPEELTGGDVLPGFTVALSELFAPMATP